MTSLDAVRNKTLNDPEWFCHDILGSRPYDKQIEIFEAVRDYEQVSINGANGVGKDWTTGRLIPWWIMSHCFPCPECAPELVRADGSMAPAPPDWTPLCKVILAAPTARQVNEIVWRETRYAYNAAKIPLGGRMLPEAAKWVIADQCFALGFSTDKAWNITGFHSPHLLVIVSEAHNFPEDAFVALKRLNPERWVLSFNPFSQSGEAYASHHAKRHLYKAIKISAMDSPNVIHNNHETPGVVSREEIKKHADDWGEESAFYRATVLAEFAETEDNLIPLAWVTMASERPVVDEIPLVASLDVAGPGEDETVLTIRGGRNVYLQKGWRIADPRGEVATELEPYKLQLEAVNVDSAGIGYYMALHLQDLGYNVRFINVGLAAGDPKFVNLKAELYWNLRTLLKDGEINGVTDERTKAQLTAIKYGHNSKGQVAIERKEELKKRGEESPDWAESLMLCFAYGGYGRPADELRDLVSAATPATPAAVRRTASELDEIDDEKVLSSFRTKVF